MSLTILSVAYPFAPVTADPTGGSEQVLSALDRALTGAGHESIVVACEGSAVSGELFSFPTPEAPIEGDKWERTHALMRTRIAEATDRFQPDVIHLHGLDFGSYVPPPGPAVLVTLHLPVAWYDPAFVRPTRPRLYLQPVSADQAARAEPDVRLIDPIPNGIDVDRYRPMPKGDYALVIGRVAEEKGFHDALDAAKRAGARLHVAGKVFPYEEHQRYFAEQVAPRFDAERRWLGCVEGEPKARLLAEARCVLVPSTAAETSSLVAMEALASGTPVIAYRSGALPEIVEDGVTGFLVDDVDGMAAAIGRVGAIDPTACRAAAVTRFPWERTMRAYFDLYHRLAA